MKKDKIDMRMEYLKPEIEIIGMEVETPMLAKSIAIIKGRGNSASGNGHDFGSAGSYTFGEEW